ncbi:MAG: Na(+)/H(+) antiporter subunit D, partial [Pseudomonadota bacterium]
MIEGLTAINPGLILIVAGALCALVPQVRVRQSIAIGAPILAGILLGIAPHEIDLASLSTMGLDLVLYRVDNLNFIFGVAFLIAATLNGIYALHQDDQVQDASALIYAGAAVAATFVGDFLSLFIFWELTAISSVFLILKSETRAAYGAAMRYLAIQVLSGVLLLYGAAQLFAATGDITLRTLSLGADAGTWMLLIAFGIKAAFPLLHNWLQDAYPRATVVGAVVLSAFTTKLAVYVLARVFPGEPLLIWVGATMTVFPVFFAVIENDLRKVLAYSLNNQVGFMVCAIGVGSQLAMNGAAAHAFAHIIYKGLLFMSMGAVLYRTGTTKATELGGLYRSMPWTALFCMIGAASISAFPLFSGFVAKSLTMSAVLEAHYVVAWAMLLFASAGVLEHSGIKIPYFAFFGHDSGKYVEEAPFNMLLAMGLAAFICIAIGLPTFLGGGYGMLYAVLPYPDFALTYQPYTLDHILTQMQLLILAAFAFVLLKRFGLYPAEKPGTVLDADWAYRRAGYGAARWSGAVWAKAGPAMTDVCRGLYQRAFDRIEAAFSPQGVLARGPLTGGMAVWSAALLGLVLLLSFI